MLQTSKLITSTPKPVTKSHKNQQNSTTSQNVSQRKAFRTTGYQSNLLRLLSTTAMDESLPGQSGQSEALSSQDLLDIDEHSLTGSDRAIANDDMAGGDGGTSMPSTPRNITDSNRDKNESRSDSASDNDCASAPLFSRRYRGYSRQSQPTLELSHIVVPPNSPDSDDTNVGRETKLGDAYASRVDRILQIMNTAESDYAQHNVRVVRQFDNKQQQLIGQQRSGQQRLDVDTEGRPCPYSYYALFFMLAANLFGFALSLSYQVIGLLKLNCDRLLRRAWHHWSATGGMSAHKDVSLLMGILLVPIVVAILLVYLTVWMLFVVNRFLLSAVPTRLAQMINFNIQIVQ